MTITIVSSVMRQDLMRSDVVASDRAFNYRLR
jgi:hypothetical protein